MVRQNEKEDWNSRATDDAYHWVVTSKRDWDKEEYYTSGEQHFKELVGPIIKDFDTSHMTALDYGCGTGRITRFMKGVFQKVIGTDISEVMIEQAKKDNPGIDFFATNGKDLSILGTESVDFVFSYATLQHMTSHASIAKLVGEIHRVLRKGGVARFDVRGTPGGALGSMLFWSARDSFFYGITLWHRYIPVPYMRFYDSLFGACFSKHQFQEMLRSKRFKIQDIGEDNERVLWASVIK